MANGENLKDLFNPCILVMQDDSKHGKYIVGMSCYKNLETYALNKKQLTKINKGIFTDSDNNIYTVIYNQH